MVGEWEDRSLTLACFARDGGGREQCYVAWAEDGRRSMRIGVGNGRLGLGMRQGLH